MKKKQTSKPVIPPPYEKQTELSPPHYHQNNCIYNMTAFKWTDLLQSFQAKLLQKQYMYKDSSW